MMKLEKLEIHQMPGFRQGGPPLENLSDGLNIIVGANGSGKTTICKAIKGVLSGESLNNLKPVDVLSRWKDGANKTVLERQGNVIRCQVNGIDQESDFNLPLHLVNCCTITHEDLNTSGNTHEHLTEDVIRQTAGGYNIRDLRANDDRFKINTRRERKDLKDLREQQNQLRLLQVQQEQLLEEEHELPELEKQRENARKAESTLDQLDNAKSLLNLKEKKEIVEAQLKQFPPDMNKLRGDELEQLEEIKRNIETAHKTQEQEVDKKKKLKDQITGTGLKEPIDQIPLLKIKESINECKTLESRISDLNTHKQGAKAQLDGAKKDLALLKPEKGLETIDITKFDNVEDLYEQSVALKNNRKEINSQIGRLLNDPVKTSSETIHSGMQRLREWLRIPEASTASTLLPVWVIWIGALFLTALTLYIAITLYIWAYGFLIPIILISIAPLKRGDDPYKRKREIISGQYLELSLEIFERWSTDQVQSALKKLEELYLQTRKIERDLQEREKLELELRNLEGEAEDLEQKWNQLMLEMGLEQDLSQTTLVQLSRRLLQYRQYQDTYTGIQAETEKRQSELSEMLTEMNTFFKPFGYPESKTSLDADVTLKDLEERQRNFIQSKKELVDCETAIGRTTRDIEEHKGKEQALYARIKIDPPDEEELRERSARLEQFQALSQSCQNLTTQSDLMEKQLQNNPDLIALDREKISELELSLKNEAEQYSALNERIEKIKLKVEEAGRSQQIELAMEKVDICLDRIYQNQTDALFSTASNFLLDLVETEYETTAQPPVIKEANRLFSLFTNGGYSLKVDVTAQDSKEVLFRAIDNQKEQGLYLNELSTGTLVQLLLAIRIAFVSVSEGELKLPLLLDETLNSSDPKRFAAIAGCLLKLIQKEDRQLFYFTCQPVDARIWKAHAEQENYQKTVTVNLDKISSEQKSEKTPLNLAKIQGDQVPAPKGKDLASYGKQIHAPGFDPSTPIGELHLIHLVESPDQLYNLLQIGIRTWGQLHALKEKGDTDLFLSPEDLSRVSAKAKLLENLARTWRIGRGKPVDRETILNAGITDNFIEAVMKTAKRLNYDAAALVQAMENKEISRLRTDSISTVKENLIDEGYIDPNPVVDKESAYSRILGSMTADIKSGTIEKHEVYSLFERYWPE